MVKRLKYVRIRRTDEIIIFPLTIPHAHFSKIFGITSAGFCFINGEKETVECFGESASLGISSRTSDTKIATQQIFG